MRRRGRPVKSKIRERMQEIVDSLGVTYGYEIYKVYNSAFEPVDLRSMYYHLAKGLRLNEFQEVGVKTERGQFTWGNLSIRKYYILGPNATNKSSDKIRIIIKSLGLESRDLKGFVDWRIVYNENLKDITTKVERFLKTKPLAIGEVKNLYSEIENLERWLKKYTSIEELSALKVRLKSFI